LPFFIFALPISITLQAFSDSVSPSLNNYMSIRYREYTHLDLPAVEAQVLARWEEEKAFEKSLEVRKGAKPFVFYEGPPSANGMPGIHHVISRTLKDLVCRFKTMQGHLVNRKGGWDTHGLPVELGVEKELGITREDIGKKISVAQYNEKCREAVLRYKDKWEELTRKMGYWVDLSDPYITFKTEYIETLWWILRQFYDRNLLYESVSIQPYSPAAGTGLSSHELNQPGTYKMVKDTSCVVMFRARRDAHSEFLFQRAGTAEVFFLAWTTTPWTLPSNLGLAVGEQLDYTLVSTFNPYTHLPVHVVLAGALVHKFFKPESENGDFEAYSTVRGGAHPSADQVSQGIPWKTILECRGLQLENCRYEQLLPYPANQPAGGDPFRVVLGDFVTTEEGTGIVHTAPAFGADDFKVGKKYDLGMLIMVDRQGKFIDGLGEFSHRYVKDYTDDPSYVDVNVDICVKLKKENRAFKIEKFEHSYPHCWRTDKPVLYYPLDAWFIRTTALKDKMVELNRQINWKPKSTGEGRFGNWLENMVDWNLSRSRFWGTPLPIWRTEEGDEEKCIGTVNELVAEAALADKILGKEAANHLSAAQVDLHKPFVDDIVLVSRSGKKMRRVPDLVDVWFDSGAMPYAQWGLDPRLLESGAERPFLFPFQKDYPADFIAEGVDQTRGWFYTLHAISVLLNGSVAYRTCVSNGLVLDKAGNKMSKRLGNVVDPFKTLAEFGADATRWYLITNASPWESMKFDTEGIREVQRKFFGTVYNTYQFFALYANVDGFAFRESPVPPGERQEIDRWILSSLNTLIRKVTECLEDYEPTVAGRLMEDFIDMHLSNWYVRLSRRRFWKGEYEQDKIAAYQTLYECLESFLRLMAPISPFFADWLFCNLNEVTGRTGVQSIHHADFPKPDPAAIDELLEERMQMAQDISSLVLSLRKKVNIKVRQPLQKVLIPILYPGMREQLEKVEDLIRSEVNVKEIAYLVDTDGFIRKKIKPNYVALGRKLGSRMKSLTNALSEFTQQDIAQLEKEGHYNLFIDNEPLILQVNEVEIAGEDIPGWLVANKGKLTVALDVQLTPELSNEGNARELVNRIQKIRKDNGYELTDRILVQVQDAPPLKETITRFNDYICAEILADAIELVPEMANGTEIEVNDVPLKVFVSKKA
jgi:isoleucyl-tRNA synthetase